MAETFNPSDFDADQLLRWAQGVGFRYIVPTTKHHDGFAMFRTAGARVCTRAGVCVRAYV